MTDINLIVRPPVGTRVMDIKRPSPDDGKVRSSVIRHDPQFLTKEMTEKYYEYLLGWVGDALPVGGAKSTRRMIQIADSSGYQYPGLPGASRPFEGYPIIDILRHIIRDRTGHWFNYCLFTFYPNDSGLEWQSILDDSIQKRSPIYMLSFGGIKRRFIVRTRPDGLVGDQENVVLDQTIKTGSLVVMDGDSQSTTEHCISMFPAKTITALKNTGIGSERITLTFHMIKQ